jgi:hypothetical protein
VLVSNDVICLVMAAAVTNFFVNFCLSGKNNKYNSLHIKISVF